MTGGLAAVTGLRCMVCGTVYRPDEVAYVCPDHGVDGTLDVLYDHERVAAGWRRDDLSGAPRSMWRYRPLIPVGAEAPPPLRVGWTPLVPARRLGEVIGAASLWVKDEGVQPTGSLKDRASAVAVMKAAETGAGTVTTASTGNAAAALAGMAAATGTLAVILVPASAPQAKVAQLLAYGATVVLVEGSYDDAVDLCLRAAPSLGWYNRTTGYNPYMTEGKKTAAFEIAEQLGWEVPDAVVVSVGDGCIIGGLHKGFSDLVALGWVDRLPRLIGVQSTGSAFLAEAWEGDEDVLTKRPIDAHTVADSISAGLPRDRLKAMRAVRETDGAFIAIDDTEILAAIPELARLTGIFAEPAAAASVAGLQAALERGLVERGERIVAVSTGTGLKDVGAAMAAVEAAGTRPHRVVPGEGAVNEIARAALAGGGVR